MHTYTILYSVCMQSSTIAYKILQYAITGIPQRQTIYLSFAHNAASLIHGWSGFDYIVNYTQTQIQTCTRSETFEI